VRLTGKVAVVNGAAQGIGAAIATRLASEGATVTIGDVNSNGAKQVAADLSTDERQALGQMLDASNLASVRTMVNAVREQLGPIDILVNNAGIERIEPFLDSEPGTWDRLLAVNLRGTIAMCHAVAPKMSERGTGRIVNVASDAGRVGSSGEVVYSGTKGGVTAFSNALARELARSDVTVDVVCPGPTDTAASTGSRSEPETYESLQRAIPFVASQGRWTSRRPWGSSHLMMPPISGQTLSVSGGLTMA